MTTDAKKDTPIIVWFRLDLRTHDHPALHMALQDANEIIPVYIFDDSNEDEFVSSNRNRFLLESLKDLKASLKKVGGDLVVREGNSVEVLLALSEQTGAKDVYYTAEYSPASLRRDKAVEETLNGKGIEARSFGGYLAVSSLQKLVTKTGTQYKVFTPFWKTWSDVRRREVVDAPSKISLAEVEAGELPPLIALNKEERLSQNVVKGGEKEGRKRLHAFLDGPIEDYKNDNNDMGKEGTSHLSP